MGTSEAFPFLRLLEANGVPTPYSERERRETFQ